ncbi:hypothetical protein Slin15195_G004540 [Septoria linicola]|uniref:2EXR domain-containing protein n=1 Tax=Septoria linicola TaxID=215465 RepID=A0A9Q9ADJ1_9PEZI|nr:hypothetical protein Slin14017_G004580 [Septoria linicola]USW47135.1 hypothetical protein Slin15195_G004540 [Septoria linicola]
MRQHSALISAPAQPKLIATSHKRKASNSNAERPKSKTSFLDLPGELRNRIYRLVLRRPHSIKIVSRRLPPKQFDSSDHHNLKRGGPPLLRASTDIRREASEIYYLENTFTFINGALNLGAVEAFNNQLGRLSRKFNHVKVCRTIQIGDMKKPAEICFTASIEPPTPHVVLSRKAYHRRVYVPGMVKLKSKYVEPCRCQVDKLAKRIGSPKRMNGYDLIAFLEAYCDMINAEAQEVMLDICKKCDTIRRD